MIKWLEIMATSSNKILVVIGHPKSDSFCHALADSFVKGVKENNNNQIKIIDLYKEKFNPVYDLEEDAADVIKYQGTVSYTHLRAHET